MKRNWGLQLNWEMTQFQTCEEWLIERLGNAPKESL